MTSEAKENLLFEDPPPLKKVVAIGKLWLESDHREDDDEKVHILIFEETVSDGQEGLSAVCLEYSLFVWGRDMGEARARIQDYVDSHVKILNRTPEGRHQKFQLLGEIYMAKFWALYRQITELVGDPESDVHREKDSQIREKESKLREVEDALREHEERLMMLKVDKDQLERRYEETIAKVRS